MTYDALGPVYDQHSHVVVARAFCRAIEPMLGALTKLDATAATPFGPVTVRYRVAAGKLEAEITRPAALPGEFSWKGKTIPLHDVVTRLTLPAAQTQP